MEIKKQTNLRGELTVPGDKSISHRAVMFGSLAQGTTKITHFLEGADCLSTISCFRKMGIDIERNASEILVHGKGLHGLSAPSETLDVGNSGTTDLRNSGRTVFYQRIKRRRFHSVPSNEKDYDSSSVYGR